jgi:hypothetical protein
VVLAKVERKCQRAPGLCLARADSLVSLVELDRERPAAPRAALTPRRA